MNFIDSIFNTDDYQKRILNDLRSGNKPIVIFGASVYAYVLFQYLKASGVHVEGIVVNRDYITRSSFMGLKVRAFEEIEERLEDYHVVVGIANYPDVLERYSAKGIHGLKVVDVPDFLNIPERFMDRKFVQTHLDDFEKTYNLFSDELSKETFIAAINTKVTQNIKHIEPFVRLDHLYFPTDEFKLGREEVFLDVGGFDGDSIRDFHNHTQEEYKEIISLEPFEKNFKMLQKTVEELGIQDRCTLFQVGAWDKKTELSFQKTELGIDNRISDNGQKRILVDKIDAILNDEFPVSMIKMDINGAECRAILGAQDTIRKYRPKLAIKMHVKEHFYQLPILLKEISPDIKLFLRQRNYMSMMLVLYGYY